MTLYDVRIVTADVARLVRFYREVTITRTHLINDASRSDTTGHRAGAALIEAGLR
jgi:hypothetical protein